MQTMVPMEDIEGMRRLEGIEDPELEEQIRGLRRGDVVKITFLDAVRSPAGETLPVRITSVRGSQFRGKLARRPTSPRLSALWDGEAITFTAAHIHSVTRTRPL